MEIITGKTGSNHVTSADDGQLHALTFGKGNILFDSNENFEATLIDNNTIKIASGDVMMDGRHGRIRYGEYEYVTIDNGATGYYRQDLIAIVYRNVNGIESMSIEVIKGQFTTEPMGVPRIENDYDITTGDSIKYLPLHHVYLDGLATPIVTPMGDPTKTMKLNKSLSVLGDLGGLTKEGYIADAMLVKELKDSLKPKKSACVENATYNTAVNTTWTNNLYYKNQIIDCALVIRLNEIAANTDYGIFNIPSGYQPPAEISKLYITHLGTKVLVTFRPTNVIIIKPLSDITTPSEILYIHETWVQF